MEAVKASSDIFSPEISDISISSYKCFAQQLFHRKQLNMRAPQIVYCEVEVVYMSRSEVNNWCPICKFQKGSKTQRLHVITYFSKPLMVWTTKTQMNIEIHLVKPDEKVDVFYGVRPWPWNQNAVNTALVGHYTSRCQTCYTTYS